MKSTTEYFFRLFNFLIDWQGPVIRQALLRKNKFGETNSKYIIIKLGV